MMAEPFYPILIYSLSLISYVLLLIVFTGKPSVRYWVPCIGTVLCVIYVNSVQVPLRIIPSTLAFLCVFFSLRGSLVSVIRTFSLMFLLNECITGIWGCIFIMLYADASAKRPTVLLEYVLSITTYMIIIVVRHSLIRKCPKTKSSHLSSRRIRLSYYSVILMAVSLVFTVAVLKYLINLTSSGFMWYFTIALIIFAYLGIGGVAMQFDFTLTSNQHMKEMLQQEQLTSAIMHGYNQALQEQDAAIRTYRHDINNHLLSLQHLIDSNDQESACNYLKSMVSALSDTKVTVTPSGNTLVDAISNYYMGLLPDKSIFRIRASLPEVLPVDSYSFTTIYANLLQNAVEAVLSQDSHLDPSISVTLKQTYHFLQVVIENSFSNRVEKHYIHGSSDIKNHGFGLINVKKTVATLNGTFSISEEGTLFKVSVALPLLP